MSVLPPHVSPCADRPGECEGDVFDVNVDTDGLTRAYECARCGDLLADLIEGAEP